MTQKMNNAKTMPLVITSKRVVARSRARRWLGISTQGAFALFLSTSTAAFTTAYIALSIYVKPEPYAVTNSLAELQTMVHDLEQHEFVSRLNAAEQYDIANKIQFVSNLIGDRNKNKSNQVAASIVTESMKAKIDPLFVAAVVKSESTFKTNAVSPKGARGLMQLMPGTARFTEAQLQKPLWRQKDGKIHDIEYNLSLGITYLKHLEDAFDGNREHALIAYNWGPNNLKRALKYNAHIPSSTRAYAQKIMRTHERWQGEIKYMAFATPANEQRKLPA
jgi:soluble lytic murein transglycosylase-like protein